MSREFIATVDGVDTTVRVAQHHDGRFVVHIGEREELVHALPVRPGTWSLLIGDRSYVVELDQRGAARMVGHRKNEFLSDMDDAQRKHIARAVASRSNNKSRGETVRAPIAGRVVKVLVAEGDDVDPGQGVLVLEAMKMENELKAERGGKVAAVHASAGQSVETGDKLLILA